MINVRDNWLETGDGAAHHHGAEQAEEMSGTRGTGLGCKYKQITRR